MNVSETEDLKMRNFNGLVLCDVKRDDVETHVRAGINDGCLTISGQDLGPLVESVWGEYGYEENTGALLRLIGGLNSPETALKREFSGENGCRRMRELCDDNGIEFSFWSYL